MLGVMAAAPLGGLQARLGRLQTRAAASSRLVVRCSNNGSVHSSLKVDEYQEFPKTSGIFHALQSFIKEQLLEFRKIEWPSVENTVKTSFFVIVLSFILIVALTAVDSGFTFVLAKMVK